MRLKSIEIQGFKSFANRISFEFPDGITAIVGPNGSGKSNVADAVRWVLGEQKVKQLRSSRMDDVIFAGTAERKPKGYAYVSLTLDNSDRRLALDYSEVTVSRRIYRSGESEYLLNGSATRLKDLQELFYDTGIGKEGYSIIGQGQIDKILQGKPEERRELFDEAAGIVKYKKRKAIALRKLENERLNLARVDDILGELSKQVGPLKKQSEAALKFIEYENELKEYDINLFLIEGGQIKEKIAEYESKRAAAEEELRDEKKALCDLKSRYEELSVELSGIETEIEEAKERLASGSVLKESLNGRINVLNEQINSAADTKSHYRERVEALSASLERAERERDRLCDEKEDNQEELTKVIRESACAASRLLDIQNELEENRLCQESLKERLAELVNEKSKIGVAAERLNTLCEQMGNKRRELCESLEKYSADKEAQSQVIKEAEEKLAEEMGASEELSGEISEKESEAAALKGDLEKCRSDISKAKEELARLEARKESIRNITERYEGYGSVTQEIMKLKKDNPGIFGVVADILRTEKKYETAIETALGGNIRNIVTDTEATAKSVIEYLKKNKLGRATFLPVKAVAGRGEFKNEEVFGEKGVVGTASSLVESDETYRGVVNFLLGRIIVCDNIDNALLTARKYNYSLMIVTLEGELLNRGGSLSGGAYKNKSNLLGRRRELDELERAIEKNGRDRDLLREKEELLEKNIEKAEKEISKLGSELQEGKIRESTLKVSLEQAILRQEEIESGFSLASGENEDMNRAEEEMAAQKEALGARLSENASESEDVKARIEEAVSEAKAMQEEESKAREASSQLGEEKSRLAGQNSVIVQAIIKTENEIGILKGELEKIRSSAEAQADEEDFRQQIEEIRREIAKADEEAAQVSGQLAALEASREEFASSNREYTEKRESVQNNITELDKEVFRLSQLKEKMEERFENKSSYIWEEYELTYNGAKDMRNEDLADTKEMRAHISSLKSRIRELGTINTSAIEEYREVSGRYEFLTDQRRDLKEAEEDLVKIIKDLDREMRRQFNEEFKKIQEEFGKVFSEMFGGGTGSITLEESTDVLDALITITAQPPGKKLQNMMQLSGGEKALTAIAVLFAIQNLKPSPFCILDEIEAALDDSNIVRFASYLHRLESDVQFIVITHRKGTMEAAGRLYGITMQEKGVSTLISVNLADYNEKEAEVS